MIMMKSLRMPSRFVATISCILFFYTWKDTDILFEAFWLVCTNMLLLLLMPQKVKTAWDEKFQAGLDFWEKTPQLSFRLTQVSFGLETNPGSFDFSSFPLLDLVHFAPDPTRSWVWVQRTHLQLCNFCKDGQKQSHIKLNENTSSLCKEYNLQSLPKTLRICIEKLVF